MQKTVSLILVLSFFSYQSYHSLIYIGYMINKTYYINVLCENKNNPKKPACNGKCHLKKQLEKKDPVEDQNPFSKSATFVSYPELIAVLLGKLYLLYPQTAYQNNAKFCKKRILSPYLTDIFHPPKSLSFLLI
jgi:hypothetical protein